MTTLVTSDISSCVAKGDNESVLPPDIEVVWMNSVVCCRGIMICVDDTDNS